MKKSDTRGAGISRVSLKPLWRHVKMTQPSSSSDCGGCGSGLGGLVLMDGGSVRRRSDESSAGCWSFHPGNGSVDSEAQNCNHS